MESFGGKNVGLIWRKSNSTKGQRWEFANKRTEAKCTLSMMMSFFRWEALKAIPKPLQILCSLPITYAGPAPCVSAAKHIPTCVSAFAHLCLERILWLFGLTCSRAFRQLKAVKQAVKVKLVGPSRKRSGKAVGDFKHWLISFNTFSVQTSSLGHNLCLCPHQLEEASRARFFPCGKVVG